MLSKQTLIVIEAGHLSKTAVSGGDLLMQGMVPYLGAFDIEIILPLMARKHWKMKRGIRFHTLPPFFSEASTLPLFVFITYLWRSLHSILYLIKKSGQYMLYSSTNSFVDTFPAFIIQKMKKIPWIARVHHLVEHPSRRPGNYVVNYFSFLLDRISLSCIRNATLIIALNKDLQQSLIKMGFSTKRVMVLGGGVDFEKISNYSP